MRKSSARRDGRRRERGPGVRKPARRSVPMGLLCPSPPATGAVGTDGPRRAIYRCLSRALLCAAVFSLCGSAAQAEDVALPEVTSEGHEERPGAPATKDSTSFSTNVPRREGESARASDWVSRPPPELLVRDFGLNQPATVSLRGSTFRSGCGLDRRRAAQPRGRRRDLFLAGPARVGRPRSGHPWGGGGALRCGAVGGVVSLETRRPEPGVRESFGELGYGSFSSAQGSTGVAGSVSLAICGLLTAFAQAHRRLHRIPTPTDPAPTKPQDIHWLTRENNESRRAGALGRLSWSGPVEGDCIVETDGGLRGVPGPIEAPTPDARQDGLRGSATARASVPPATACASRRARARG